MKLTSKFLLIIVATTIVVSLASGFVSFDATKLALTDSIGENQKFFADQIMQRIDRLFYERYLDMEDMSNSAIIKRFLKDKDTYYEETARRLSNFSVTTGPWDVITVIDKNGEGVISTLESEIGRNEKNNPKYIAIFEAASKGVYYSNVILSEEFGRPTVVFAAPIQDDEKLGRPLIGFIFAQFSWPAVNEILTDISLPTVIHLFNKQGLVLSYNCGKNHNALVDDFSKSDVFKTASSQNYGFGVLDGIDGEGQTLVSFARQKGYLKYKGEGLILTVEIPVNIAFSSAINTAIRVTIFQIIIIIISVILLWYLLITFAVKPINKLIKNVKAMAAGNLNQKISVFSHDEIGELGESFNDMAFKLRSSYENLEKKIKERTKDLELEKNKVAKEKSKIDALFSSIGEGIVATDEKGMIIFVNKAAEQILGWDSQENLNKLVQDVLSIKNEKGELLISGSRPLERVLKTKEKVVSSVLNPFYYVKKDGTIFPAAIVASPIIFEGKIVGVIDVFRDITKDWEVDRAKSEFISLASHQLRTPLTAMKWLVELLLNKRYGALTIKQKKALQNINKSNESLISLVNDLLNISRMESGHLVISPKIVDLVEINKQIVKEFESLGAHKNQKILFKYNKDSVKTYIDPVLYTQALQNLISNAFTYGSSNTEIIVNLEINKNKDCVSISVEDQGLAISEEERKKLFTKFFRAESARMVNVRGTGLGLYVVKSAVEANAGMVGVESDNGRTKFWFTVPIKSN